MSITLRISFGFILKGLVSFILVYLLTVEVMLELTLHVRLQVEAARFTTWYTWELKISISFIVIIITIITSIKVKKSRRSTPEVFL